MDEVIAQTRRTTNLIGLLDSQVDSELAAVESNLKQFYDHPSRDLALKASIGLQRAHFLRTNTASEALYLQDFVEDAYNFKKKELESIDLKLQQYDSADKKEDVSGAQQENEPVYCTCRRGFFGQMIACENPKCPIEWYHLGCVGLKTVPRGDWICAICQKKRTL